MENINWFSIMQQTLLITSFVIMMMLLIEFINVYTKGKFTNKIKNKPISQIAIGVLLGLLPGCMGVFTVVSLYTHGVLSFGALVAAMIATSGDEAFFMIALIPDKVLIIFVIMTIAAFVTGFAVDKLLKNYNPAKAKKFKFVIHEENCANHNTRLLSFANTDFSLRRMIVIAGLLLTITGAGFGWIMHAHGHNLLFTLPDNIQQEIEKEEIMHSACGHSHDNHHNHIHDEHCEHSNVGEVESDEGPNIDWIAISIIVIAAICILIVLFSNSHFIDSHIWNHLVKKHLSKILLWTAGIMLLINIGLAYTEFGEWIYDNMFLVLIIAILVGIIPESGPHLLFLILFVYGQIPLSILIASSIVQDGHGSLPLLAESKRTFISMKVINMIVAFIIGFTGLLIGY